MPQEESSPPETVVKLIDYIESPQASSEEKEVVQAFFERLAMLKNYKEDEIVKRLLETFEMIALLKLDDPKEPIINFVTQINEQLDSLALKKGAVLAPKSDYDEAEKKALFRRSTHQIRSERAKAVHKGANRGNQLEKQQAVLAKLRALEEQLTAKAQQRAKQRAKLEAAQKRLEALKAKQAQRKAEKHAKNIEVPADTPTDTEPSSNKPTNWPESARSAFEQSAFASLDKNSSLGKDIQDRIENINDSASYEQFKSDLSKANSNQALSFVQQGIDSLNERAQKRTTIGAGKKAIAIQTAVNNLTLADRATFPEPKSSPKVTAVLKAMDKKRVPNPFVKSAKTMETFKQRLKAHKARNNNEPAVTASHRSPGPG